MAGVADGNLYFRNGTRLIRDVRAETVAHRGTPLFPIRDRCGSRQCESPKYRGGS